MKDTWFVLFVRVGILVTICLMAPMLHAEEPFHIWPTTEWKTSSPEEHGINSSRLDDLYANERFTGNLLLVRHGFLVAERYDQEQGKAFAPHIFSMIRYKG